MNLKAAEQFGEVTATAPFSPRVLKLKFTVWRVFWAVGFCLFTFLELSFKGNLKKSCGEDLGQVTKTSWGSESLGLLQKAKRTENISQEDCTRWEGWRWWNATEIISKVRKNRWDAQTQTSMEHSPKVKQITFQGQIHLNWKSITVLGSWLLKQPKNPAPPCKSSSRIYCCLIHHSFYFYSKRGLPSTKFSQSCRWDLIFFPLNSCQALPSSSTQFFSKCWFFIWLPVTLEWNSRVELCWWQIISICAYFVSNIRNFGTSQSILQEQSCFPERQRCQAFNSTSSWVLQLHREQVCSVLNSHL